MDQITLAHAGGIDELAIFLFPVILGIGFAIIMKRNQSREDESEDETPREPSR